MDHSVDGTETLTVPADALGPGRFTGRHRRARVGSDQRLRTTGDWGTGRSVERGQVDPFRPEYKGLQYDARFYECP